MDEPTSGDFVVDFTALIELLADFLYRDKSAVIRELLANANDALIARKREFGFDQDEPWIRIWLDRSAGQMVVQDNGIGMSHGELIDYLSTIAASMTRQRSHRYSGDRAITNLQIGKFGVGFLSSFVVAEKVTVFTRQPGHPGYRWESERIAPETRRKQVGKGYTITEDETAQIGTKVVLDLRGAVQGEWTEELIKKFILENARHFFYPIYWGAKGSEKLNDLQAPWYESEPPEESNLESYRKFLSSYGDMYVVSASEIIPLFHPDIRGVLYIPRMATPQDSPGRVDLYCKRVFVTRDDSDIVLPEFRFVRGIVDCVTFRLSASRESVQKDNHEYRMVQEYIGRRILDYFAALAQRAATSGTDTSQDSSAEDARLRIQTVLDQVHIMIESALVARTAQGFTWDDRYLTALARFLPFRSSTGGVTTTVEYLQRRVKAGMSQEVLFVDTDEEYLELRQLAEQQDMEFLWLKHDVERPYLDRYCHILGVPCRPAREALSAILAELPVDPAWQQIISYYQFQLSHPEFSLSVHLAEFPSETIGGRLVIGSGPEGRRQILDMLKQMELSQVFPKDDPMLRELRQVGQKRPFDLYINKNHRVLNQLVKLLDDRPDFPLDFILHPLFHDIAGAAGHPVPESHLTEYQASVYESALEKADIKQRLFVSDNQLKAERHQKAELQAQVDSLRKILEDIQHKPSTHLTTTNEVLFIRPMEDNQFIGFASAQIKAICEQRDLKLVDPSEMSEAGNIPAQIIERLRRSRLVIADISELSRANVYYEVGVVTATHPHKLILIAEKHIIEAGQIAFYFKHERVIGYTTDAPGFAEFLGKLGQTIDGVLAKEAR